MIEAKKNISPMIGGKQEEMGVACGFHATPNC